MKGAIAVIAVAVVLSTVPAARAQLVVRSTAGATCRVTNNGTAFDSFVMPDKGEENSVHIGHGVPDGWRPAIVTCEKAGYRAKSVMVVPIPECGFIKWDPCAPVLGPVPERNVTQCLNHFMAQAMGCDASSRYLGLPVAVDYLDREDGKKSP